MRIQLVLLVLLCAASGVLADGKIMSRVSPDVPIPDQQTLIHYADGVETLVIETSFVGEGNEFAWIVPLPAVPEVKEVSAGIFPSLRATAMPLVHDETDLTLGFLAIGICGFIVVYSRCSADQRAKLVGVVFLVAILCVVFLPALGAARRGVGSSAQIDGVNVHARQQIGKYDVATISAGNSKALLDWLKTNDFKPPLGIEHVVDNYIQDGWVFVAVKMDREGAKREGITPPLMFRYSTAKPVYPMRLTGLTDKDVRVELWVFGEDRAEAPGFNVAQCKKIRIDVPFKSSGYRVYLHSEEKPRLEHARLAQIVAGSTVLTKLTANLKPPQMGADLYLSFRPFEYKEESYYSRRAREVWIVNWLIVCGSVISLVTYMMLSAKPSDPTRIQKISIQVGIACITCVLFILLRSLFMDVIDVHRVNPIMLTKYGMDIQRALMKAFYDCKDLDMATPEWAQAVVNEAIAKVPEEYRKALPNIRHGDVPLGYTLHHSPNRHKSSLILVLYNEADGVADTTTDIPLKEVLLSDEWRYRKESHDANH